MKIAKLDSGDFKIECNIDELMILSNVINNIPQAVDDVEYTTLIGATVSEIEEIHHIILDALRDVIKQ
jgi:hypothetical protein